MDWYWWALIAYGVVGLAVGGALVAAWVNARLVHSFDATLREQQTIATVAAFAALLWPLWLVAMWRVNRMAAADQQRYHAMLRRREKK